jgi:hypothetical protein
MASKPIDAWRFSTDKTCHEVLQYVRSSMTRMEIHMAQPFLNDASSLVSLLIENSNGTFEVILHRIEFDGKAGFAPVQLIPLSSAVPSMPTHSCLANAMSMQRWMEEHPDVLSQGRTAFE